MKKSIKTPRSWAHLLCLKVFYVENLFILFVNSLNVVCTTPENASSFISVSLLPLWTLSSLGSLGHSSAASSSLLLRQSPRLVSGSGFGVFRLPSDTATPVSDEPSDLILPRLPRQCSSWHERLQLTIVVALNVVGVDELLHPQPLWVPVGHLEQQSWV